MENIFCLFSVILLSGLVGVNSLQCFVCFNCTSPGDDDLRTCGEPVTTTLTPTFPSTTGIPSPPSTTPTSTTTTSTTTAPTTTTSSTTPPTTTTSTTTPPTTAPPTTTPPTTTPPTTTPPTTTPPTTTPPTTTPPTTTPPTTTTSTTTTTTTTTTEAPEEIDPPPLEPEPEGRSKRNVMSPVSRVSQFEDIEYVCYLVTAIMNNETVVERGCAPSIVNDKALCENDVIKNVTTSCRTCKTDKCNGSYAVQFSTALLAAAVVGLLLCK